MLMKFLTQKKKVKKYMTLHSNTNQNKIKELKLLEQLNLEV
jgi:hypothetical protein